MERYKVDSKKLADIYDDFPGIEELGPKNAANRIAACIEHNKQVLALDVEVMQRRIEVLNNGQIPDDITNAAFDALTGDIHAVIRYLDLVQKAKPGAMYQWFVDAILHDVKQGVVSYQLYEYCKSM